MPRSTDKSGFIAVILFLLSGLLFFPVERSVMAEEKVGLGISEEIILLPWGVRMPARIDTGAATSSLDARDLTVKDGTAEFTLPAKYGGRELKLPVVKWRVVRSAMGQKRRPVVEIELCLGSRRLLAEVNLMDRTGLKYPMLIGRNVLRKNFIVDCMKANCSPPACPEAPGK
jgi:hypothetical protein